MAKRLSYKTELMRLMCNVEEFIDDWLAEIKHGGLYFDNVACYPDGPSLEEGREYFANQKLLAEYASNSYYRVRALMSHLSNMVGRSTYDKFTKDTKNYYISAKKVKKDFYFPDPHLVKGIVWSWPTDVVSKVYTIIVSKNGKTVNVQTFEKFSSAIQFVKYEVCREDDVDFTMENDEYVDSRGYKYSLVENEFHSCEKFSRENFLKRNADMDAGKLGGLEEIVD